ncbi:MULTISPECIES: isoprenylcysteine carboxylmethyltransferase family protein [Deinococcus]|jgi:protein-S-isoprenylcysteine O-methyltransferase Ste14|uniref:Protein-S-isoprenylcysteine O-methyltransferase Ste14 n=2 Tax=Deinococcus soli (ex Cha et al. 2016) TaxID=1309411 RepID=A0AAE3XI67_9DEIO|nr:MULTISPECIES: isoprenylcysteine carboxylmethyltransferase family protein [Deinococcus]MCD0159862.1 isoprenylcysteine carboxylmethyltransferase family protein [Deinococcus sp. 6YEL10]MCD0164490.1 isoprenylcysteine carboxylmethyltransferase family protein [Deinococcus sp. 12RED42]MCD0175092.1 isoprenylcysteine carboxylmethyltransferase family protein [Deinococcus sp. 14RED07]MDK2014561.1 isoprenylcysteine carboxylmethyltransferase family protein [Deinococcus sp. 43]MDR6221123.1 protein-S-isop
MESKVLYPALFAFTLLYLLLAFVWRSVLVWRRTGANPYVLPQDDSPQGYVGAAMRLLMAAVLLTTGVMAAVPQSADLMGLLPWLVSPALQSGGWLLMADALGLTLVAQAQMGASWRIGLDARARTALVQSGVFARSRNPIFLAMRLMLLGLFLAAPQAVTLTLLVAGEVLMQVQVRLEEAYLHGVHGETYEAYRARVPRWL